MTCQDFQSRLERAVETRDALELSNLRSHGDSCATPACRDAWRDHLIIERALAAWRGSHASSAPSLADGVIRSLASTAGSSPAPQPVVRGAATDAGRIASLNRSLHSARRAAPGRSHRLAVCVTAVLLLAAAILLQMPDGRSSLATAHRSQSARRPPTESAATDSLAPKVDPASGDYAGMAQEATDFVTDLAMLVVPVDIDQQEPGWFSRLGRSLEPVRVDVEGKLDEWFGMPST